MCVGGTCIDDNDVGVGACNGLPEGAACGSDVASDCNAADTCVALACVTNEAPAGTACYDCAAGAGMCASCGDGACTDAVCTPNGEPAAKDLATTIVANNGNEGSMFDVLASQTITITSFETHSTETGMTDYEIWTKAGTHVGAEADRAQWTQVGTGSFMLLGQGVFTPIAIPVNVTVNSGERRAFYLTNKTLNNRYHNGTAVGATQASGPELTLFEGVGVDYATNGFGALNTPRAWEGKIHYRAGGGKALATTLAGNATSGGVMFDIAAKLDIRITLLAAHLSPGTHDFEIYFKRGSRTGAESDAMKWERVGAAQGVLSAGANTPTMIPIPLAIYVDGGTTTAFYITSTSTVRTQLGTAAASNSDLTINNAAPITGTFGTVGAASIANVEVAYGVCN